MELQRQQTRQTALEWPVNFGVRDEHVKEACTGAYKGGLRWQWSGVEDATRAQS